MAPVFGQPKRLAVGEPRQLGRRRAATLTPSPKISPSSTMMSPRLMPMRNRMRLISRDIGVALRQAPLHRHRGSHGIDHRVELDQHAVACGLDDTALMRGDGGSTSSLRCALSAARVPSSSLPIMREYPATSAHKNRRQPPLDTLLRHGSTSAAHYSERVARAPCAPQTCSCSTNSRTSFSISFQIWST